MIRRVTRWLEMVVVVVAVAACGGDDEPMGPEVTGGSMSATIDGTPWTAIAVTAVRGGSGGTIVAVGGSDAQPLAIGLGFIDSGPGTYDITVAASGATGNVTEGSSVWTASAVQGSGTITVTSIDAGGVAGTFSFTADLSVGTGSATRTVTNGTFDVNF